MHETYTPDDLRQYLDRQQIQAQLLFDIGHTPTVRAAAGVLEVHPDQIVKTLLFIVQHSGTTDTAEDICHTQAGSPKDISGVTTPADTDDNGALHGIGVIVLSHGERRVDTKRLAQHLGVATRSVRLARPEVVLERLGYPAGGVPPFGHRVSHPVLLERSLLATKRQFGDRIYAGGGDDRTMLETSVSELLRVLEPEIVALSIVR